METKELMIGDWVETLDGISKVVSIHDAFHIEVEDNDYAYDECEPIPLTKEILKANGFEVCYVSCYQTKYHIWLNNDNDCVEYKISKENAEYNHLKIYVNGNEKISTHLLYVHELQHALRLCGLKDLANNFKIL